MDDVLIHTSIFDHLWGYSIAMWVWVNTYRYIFSGMNIHLPAILGFTRYQGFDPIPMFHCRRVCLLPDLGFHRVNLYGWQPVPQDAISMQFS